MLGETPRRWQQSLEVVKVFSRTCSLSPSHFLFPNSSHSPSHSQSPNSNHYLSHSLFPLHAPSGPGLPLALLLLELFSLHQHQTPKQQETQGWKQTGSGNPLTEHPSPPQQLLYAWKTCGQEPRRPEQRSLRLLLQYAWKLCGQELLPPGPALGRTSKEERSGTTQQFNTSHMCQFRLVE